VSGSGSIESAN